jgi:hypothetical protein
MNDLFHDYHSVLMNLLSAGAQSLHHLLDDFHLFPTIWLVTQEFFMGSTYTLDD